ncbi:tetratricopeptide repeat protein [Methylocella sp.]|uniref:tetratricopeptide repeat protein n=1 Tax=Methylocella sp. TaxID=1978226 RepID=UPI003784244D
MDLALAREPSPERDRALLQGVIAQAFAHLGEGQPSLALAALAGGGELAARDDLASYVFGLVCFNAADLRAALSWFDRALALNPDSREALGARAIALQRLGQPQDALEAFEELARLAPDDVEARFSVGLILQSLGRMKEALAAYEEALRAKPDHCGALTNRGALLERFGRLDEALACFEATAALRPDDPGAAFNMGSVLQKLGRLEDALKAYDAAAALSPADAETQLNRGNVLHRMGRSQDALACFEAAARRPGGYPQALHNKGVALHALGRRAAALKAYDDALALDPRHCEAICNRGNLLHELGRLDEAFSAYGEALRIRPAFLPALANRANILLQWGEAEQALRCCEEALKHDGRHPQALGLRGAALHRLRRPAQALEALDAALAAKADAPEVWLNRGNVLQELDRPEEAVKAYDEALRFKPDYAEALSGLGVALKELGDADGALACFERALERKPDLHDARNNRAGALLLKGRLREGFADFESRWDRANAPPRPPLGPAPLWSGEDLAGSSILVHDEQGLGDLIQFCRYLPLVEARGARVDFVCRPTMRRLLSGLGLAARFLDAPARGAAYDYACPLMSLPRAFGSELSSLPAARAYLRAEPQAAAAWSARIGAAGFRVGVCWRGNGAVNLKRGFPPAALAPLAAIEGARLISLMRGEDALEAQPCGAFAIERLGADYDAGPDAFIDCAAAMESCDLIVTSDTAIAHLAGALGRPAFLALRQAADWRWLERRADSPWYPTMRLFRQTRRDDWAPVFEEIAAAAAPLAHEKLRASGRPPEPLLIPAGVGELIDKIVILEIKEAKAADAGADAGKLANVRRELALLRRLRAERGFSGGGLGALETELRRANTALWEVEDELRACEREGRFDARFVALARRVYATNDERAALKRAINVMFDSAIVEEKHFGGA